jgi:hypothetical protein
MRAAMPHASRKNTADALRLAVAHGIVAPRRAIDWADRLIASASDLDPALLDVASVRFPDAGESVSALGRVPGEADPVTTVRLLLVLIDEMLSRDPKDAHRVARVLYDITIRDASADGDLLMDIMHAVDALDLAHGGLRGTVADAQAEFLRVVRHHRADRIDC